MMNRISQQDSYTILADKHGFGQSAYYRKILKLLISPEQVKIVAALPMTADELSKELNIDITMIHEHLDDLFDRGIVFPRNLDIRNIYRFARNPTQLHDATLGDIRLDPILEPSLFRLWDDFHIHERYKFRVDEWMKLEQPPARILPAHKALPTNSEVLPYEDPIEILKAASTLAVVSCPCRQRQEAVRRPCKLSHNKDYRNCIQFDQGAEYAIKRGSGEQLTLDRALELLDEVEDDGLVHIWGNTSSMSAIVMCNCCNDCCISLYPITAFSVPPTKLYSKSRYEAYVDFSSCDGCQTCINRCPFDAIILDKIADSKRLKAFVDSKKCMGCGVCVVSCEPKALSLRLVRPPEHIPDVGRKVYHGP